MYEDDSEFYLFFSNMKSINAYSGYVGIGFRELNDSEYDFYCLNYNKNANFLLRAPFNNNKTFSSDLRIRIILSGCYYLNSDGFWKTDGVEIERGSAINYINCTTNHLTSFAGGFLVLPPAIDFNNAFANSSFLKNSTVYSTVIGSLLLYIILAVWAITMDQKDRKRVGITVLHNDDKITKRNYYLYEIIIFTGSRYGSGTDSKVD